MFRMGAVWGVLTAAVACAPPPWEDTGPRSRNDTPELRILFPTTSITTHYCPTFTVVVETEHYELDPEAIGDAPATGLGHWQLWEGDDCALDLLGASGTAFLTLEQPLSAGTHILYAELVTNDHQPLDPPVRHRSSIVVSDSEDCEGGDPGWGDP